MSNVESNLKSGNLFPPSSSAAPTRIANISMKLPAFWPDAEEVWFAQVDAQFAIHSISVSKTKLYLSPFFLRRLHPRSWTTEDPYEVLRERLITLYTLNNYQRFEAGISSSLRRPETLAPDEQDVSSPSG